MKELKGVRVGEKPSDNEGAQRGTGRGEAFRPDSDTEGHGRVVFQPKGYADCLMHTSPNAISGWFGNAFAVSSR